MKQPLSNPLLAAGILAFGLGFAWVLIDSMGWYYAQQSLAVNAQSSILDLVTRYYLAEAFAILTMVAGTYVIYRSLLTSGELLEPMSIRAILSSALSSRRDIRLGVVVAIVYAVVYAVVSSILVYQPTVDFASTYGVTSSSWNAAACCGVPGTVPALLLFISPQAHLAIQLVPLDLLFIVLVPILVGFNVTVATYAFRSRDVRSNAKWFGSVGLLTGLFTGCPTCAGVFLASAVGGFGATTLAVALAPYQVLFIVISIPLLLASPIVTALSVRKSMQAACALPIPSRAS